MEVLIDRTLDWANERSLVDGSATTVNRQFLKIVSEVGEFADEVVKGNLRAAVEECGDVIVTLIVTSANMGFGIDEALAAALEKITKRKGTTVNGIFVKEGDRHSGDNR